MDSVFRKKEAAVMRVGDALSAVFFVAAAGVAWQFVSLSMEARDRAPVFYFVLWSLQIVIPYAVLACAIKHGIFALRPELKPAAEGAH